MRRCKGTNNIVERVSRGREVATLHSNSFLKESQFVQTNEKKLVTKSNVPAFGVITIKRLCIYFSFE